MTQNIMKHNIALEINWCQEQLKSNHPENSDLGNLFSEYLDLKIA